MKIGLIGATGLVGSEMLKVLAERGFGKYELLPAASNRSIGKEIVFNDKKISLLSIEDVLDSAPDIVLFAVSSSVATAFAPLFAEKGCYVIDNSSAWRMHESVPLVVPQINAKAMKSSNKIIANPNCSTIQLVMALYPLHEAFTIKRVVVSTYQSVTGTGVKAVNQLINERTGKTGEMAYPYPIDLNLLPHAGSFEANGYTSEEMKLVNETRKILNDNTIQLTATVVRVPVIGGHSEAVNIEFEQPYSVDKVYELLNNMPGVVVVDNPQANEYPMPRFAQHKDEVFVGRIRRDLSKDNCLNMWIVSDNLRKGAATNAVEIAECIIGGCRILSTY